MTSRLPFSVQVFLIRTVESNRSYLLLERNERPDLGLPSLWQGISGALEPEESFADAARREVKEETGICLDSVFDTGFRHSFPVRTQWRKYYGPEPEVIEERVFYGLVDGSTEPVLSAEHKLWRWCSAEQAIDLLTFAANAACLRAVERAISR